MTARHDVTVCTLMLSWSDSCLLQPDRNELRVEGPAATPALPPVGGVLRPFTRLATVLLAALSVVVVRKDRT